MRVLILLPPSEGKTAPTSGPSLDLDSLLDADRLTAARREVMSALAEVSRSDEAASVLGLGPRSAEQVGTNLVLETSPCAPAHQLFTGVLYEAARLDSIAEEAPAGLLWSATVLFSRDCGASCPPLTWCPTTACRWARPCLDRGGCRRSGSSTWRRRSLIWLHRDW